MLLDPARQQYEGISLQDGIKQHYNQRYTQTLFDKRLIQFKRCLTKG